MYDILNMLELIFEMMSSLEMYIICYIIIIAMTIFRLRMGVARLLVFETLDEFRLVGLSARLR
jgi:hypothetical protein